MATTQTVLSVRQITNLAHLGEPYVSNTWYVISTSKWAGKPIAELAISRHKTESDAQEAMLARVKAYGY